MDNKHPRRREETPLRKLRRDRLGAVTLDETCTMARQAGHGITSAHLCRLEKGAVPLTPKMRAVLATVYGVSERTVQRAFAKTYSDAIKPESAGEKGAA